MRTRQLLEAALLKLLQEKPINTVSIRELCDTAGINRTTFYNHYGSQYDLLRDISQRFLSFVAQRLQTDRREDTQKQVALVLGYLEDNLELSRLLLNNTVEADFAERLFTLPQVTELLDAALSGCEDPQLRRDTVSFAIYGSFQLLRDWINSPVRISPEAQTERILRLARRVCSRMPDSGGKALH